MTLATVCWTALMVSAAITLGTEVVYIVRAKRYIAATGVSVLTLVLCRLLLEKALENISG